MVTVFKSFGRDNKLGGSVQCLQLLHTHNRDNLWCFLNDPHCECGEIEDNERYSYSFEVAIFTLA